jgi:hypothetical protein
VRGDVPPPYSGPRRVPPRVVELRRDEARTEEEIAKVRAALGRELRGENYPDPERVNFLKARIAYLLGNLREAREERESIIWSCYGNGGGLEVS